MNSLENFRESVKLNEGKTIAIDFDGVIHNNNKGLHDGTVYGKPIKGAIKNIKKISEKYKIIVFTCKANPERPLVNDKSGHLLVWEWLEKYDLNQYISEITHIKPNAKYYIDDKNICFTKWSKIKL